jgi:transposase
MITTQQAAKLFKVTERTIYNWVKADKIKSKNALYSADDLQRAYDKRRRKKPRLRHK